MTGNCLINNVLNQCTTSCTVAKCWKWDVVQLLSKPTRSVNYAVLILNRPIYQSQDYMNNLWNNATVRLTIDGGTVQWDKFISKLSIEQQKSMKQPDLITGDFDSISEDVLQKYENQGCKVVHTPDQSHTDFTKALMELNNYCNQHKLEINHVAVIGQSSGRLDHILGNIQTLFLVRDLELLKNNTNVYIMADDSISWLLSPGEHVIKIPEETRTRKAWCSLIPVGEACHSVVSSGLKWNLYNQPLKFGEIVSTSNTLDGSEYVTIKCSHTLLWSMRVPGLVVDLSIVGYFESSESSSDDNLAVEYILMRRPKRKRRF